MNPQYKHYVNNTLVDPHYKDELAKEISQETNQKFFRTGLSGKVTLTGRDFDLVNNAYFDTTFQYRIAMRLPDGTWNENYFTGKFMKTDCKFDRDSKTVEVKIDPVDGYTKPMAGLDKEYNLIELAPEMQRVKMWKRPIIQVYIPGDSVISCFAGGTYWEQECDPVSDENALINTYHFTRNSTSTSSSIDVSISGTPSDATGRYNKTNDYRWDYGYYSLRWERYDHCETGPISFCWWGYELNLYRNSDNKKLFTTDCNTVGTVGSPAVGTYSLTRVSGSGATGGGTMVIGGIVGGVPFLRYICDRSALPQGDGTYVNTYWIPDNDLTAKNPNYHYYIGFKANDCVFENAQLSTAPTQYGKAPNGQYYVYPSWMIYICYPVGRSRWQNSSLWFHFPMMDDYREPFRRQPLAIEDCYPLSAAIQKLLNQFAPGIIHEPTPEYSEFLYGDLNPVSGLRFARLFVTQKSNILLSNYTRPASKAPTKLADMMAMLRDCFRVYWFIDGNKFRIEHVKWFMNGGSYTGAGAIGTNLQTMINPSNMKPYSFGVNQWEFDKVDMPERYQFKYMDDVTEGFGGQPMQIISNYVQEGKIQEVTVGQFTPDIDFMLGFPDAFSKDGFALLYAQRINMVEQNIFGYENGYYDTNGNLVSPGKTGSPGTGWVNSSQQPCIAGETYQVLDYNGNQINGVYFNFWNALNQSMGRASSTNGIVMAPDGAYSMAVSWRNQTTANPTSLPVIPNGTIMGVFSAGYILPVTGVKDPYTTSYHLQNGNLAWPTLQQRYYIWDLPASVVEIDGREEYAAQLARNKKQRVTFPAETDPDPLKLILTDIYAGQPEKLSINLSSRMVDATIKFGNEDGEQ